MLFRPLSQLRYFFIRDGIRIDVPNTVPVCLPCNGISFDFWEHIMRCIRGYLFHCKRRRATTSPLFMRQKNLPIAVSPPLPYYASVINRRIHGVGRQIAYLRAGCHLLIVKKDLPRIADKRLPYYVP